MNFSVVTGSNSYITIIVDTILTHDVIDENHEAGLTMG